MSILRRLFGLLPVVILLNLFLNANTQSVNSVQCIITNSQTTIGNCIGSAIPLSLIGLGISLVVLSITFMIGEILNYGKLKDFFKRELWETIKSALIVAIIFSSLIIISGIAVGLTGTSPTLSGSGALSTNLGNLYATTDSAYLMPQLQDTYRALAGEFGLAVGSELLKSITLNTWLPIPIPSVTGIIGYVKFGSEAGIFKSAYINANQGTDLLSLITRGSAPLVQSGSALVLFDLVIFQIQHDLLYVIAALGLGVLIPVGVIVRSIPFIRGIGGTLIAAGIGLSIVYPAILVGLNVPISNYIVTLTTAQASTSTCPFSNYLLCSLYNSVVFLIQSVPGLFVGAIPIQLAFGSNAVVGHSQILTQAGSGFYTGLSGPFGMPGACNNSICYGIFPALNFTIGNVLNQIIQFFLFVIDIVIFVSVVGAIANLLGGSLRLGVGKFKIV